MAYVFRLQLKSLRHSRPFSSPALTSKLVDATNISWRCYGGSALLESCNSSAGDIDGDSVASNDTGDSGFKGNGAEDRVSTDSSLDKLRSSIYDKVRTKANVGGLDGKDHGLFDGQDNPSIKETKKSDKWQKVVNNARTLALKNKLKAAAAGNNKLALPSKMEDEDQNDFSDLDLSEAEGESPVSRQENPTFKSSVSSIIDAFQKGLKQKLQLSSQKRLTNLSSISSSSDDVTSCFKPQISEGITTSMLSKADSSIGDLVSKLKSSNFGERDKLKQVDVVQGDGDKMMKAWRGKESSLPPRAVQCGGHRPVSNQSRSKDTTEVMPDYTGSGEDRPVRKTSPSLNEATSQLPKNDSSAPQHSNFMVCVHNLPCNSNPALIKASMSTYGEVSGFFKRGRDTGFSAYIQFKTEQGMDNALAARKLQIGTSFFNIIRTDPIFSTVVRLSKVSMDTTENQLLSVCGRYGSIDTIRKRANGVYDVFYQVQEVSNMISILASLSEVTFNRSTWAATPAPLLHPLVQKNVLKTPEGQAWHDMQVQQALSRIELGMDGTWVLFEDLKRLTALGKELFKG